MEGASGDALEWALALAKAPSERVSLRQRPLPVHGMERLLQVASGASHDAVVEAAQRTGQPEADVVEAARFYAREILFHQGADAYRVLGLQRDAGQAQIKAQYRLLQQWLHPDRHTSDWDAIFAARVNAAWNHLRSHEHRSAYDTANPVRSAGDASVALPSAPWVHQSELEQAYDPAMRWRRRAPLIALVGVCALLGMLALMDSHEDPERWREQVVDIERGMPALELGKPVHGSVTDSRPKSPAPARVSALPRAGSRQIKQPVAAIPPPEPERLARRASESLASISVPAPVSALPMRPSTPDVAVRSSTTREMAHAPVKLAAIEPPRTSVPKPPRAPMPASVTRIAGSTGTSSVTAEAPLNSPTLAAAPSGHAEVVPIVSGKQVQMAQQVGDRLVHYMRGNSGGTPPIWGSLVAQQGAARLREGLRAAGGQDISSPVWRVGPSEALMRAEIRYPDGQAGRMAATLEWRQQGWWVTALSMERDL